ncbi:MAG: sialidase family protein [Acidimicrobiales bacterium]
MADRGHGGGTSPATGRRPFWLLTAGALVALGIGGGLVAQALPAGGPPMLRGNLPVNTGASDPLDLSSHNSPTLVRSPVDPDLLAVANRIDTPRFSCALHTSADGGARWAATAVPFPEGEEQPPRCYAPDVAFDRAGVLYLSFVTLAGAGNTPHAAWTASSADGGQTLSEPVRVAGPLAFQVRLAAHPTVPGRLYLSWLQAGETGTYALPTTGNPIVLSRSDDGGRTWSSPVQVSSPARARVVAPSTALGPGGEVYLAYLDLGNDRLDYHGGHGGRGGPASADPWTLVVARSGDDGRTWTETVVDDGLVPHERFVVFLPPTPSLAVDPSDGGVYVAFHDARLGDADVWLWRSTDGGGAFTAAGRVNDTPGSDGTAQYLPRLAVAPNGRLDVVYYDRRADAGNVLNQVSLQSSTDGGRHFGPHLTLSDAPFDSRIGYGGERELADLGSRLGLLSSGQRILAVWSDTRAGTIVSQKQDLALAVVGRPEASRARTPLRLSGLGLLAAGLVLLAATAARGGAGSDRRSKGS